MEIILLQLNDKLVYEGYNRNLTRRTPLGLAYVAASLLRAGHQVEIIDGSLDDLTSVEIINAAISKDPQMIGVSCTTPLFPQLVEVVRAIKIIAPDIYVVIGGPHVSALPKASLAKSGADSVCIGEGERPIMDLDNVPFPARNLLRVKEYVDYARGVLKPQTSVITSRGCVGRCGFCNAAGSPIRFRSIGNLMAELEEIQDKYGIKNLVFYDDSLTTNKYRIIEMCSEMINRRLDFSYQIQARLDQIDDEVMEWLVKSGCEQIGPGIESGNLEILKSIGKLQTPEFMIEKCEIIKKYPVKMRCSYIMGWIDETEEQVLDTIELAKRIDSDENAFSIATPYPGTRMWDVALQRGLVSEDMDFSNFLYYHKIGCNLSQISDKRLLELHESAYMEVGNRSYALT
jgi:anaerobic magnesium-protoporphyrin IX monomethyl ester cyclase